MDPSRYTVCLVSPSFVKRLTLRPRSKVNRPEKVDFDSVRAALAHVVPMCLDGDPSLVPSSTTAGTSADGGDPDDFRFWSERQAWRIARSVREMFGVEYAPDVVMADANLSALAQRIIASRQIIME